MLAKKICLVDQARVCIHLLPTAGSALWSAPSWCRSDVLPLLLNNLCKAWGRSGVPAGAALGHPLWAAARAAAWCWR